MKILDRHFLEEKGYTREGDHYPVRASNGNIKVLTDCVLTYTEYNFLPYAGSELDGHYTFFVNVQNFQYLVYKSANYGSLTYVLPSNDTSFLVLNNVDKKIVEAKIACKLLGAHYHKDEHGKRKNLIEHSGYEGSLLCDYRGYIWCELNPDLKDSIARLACTILDPNYISLENPSIKLDWGNRSQQRFTVEYKQYKTLTDKVIVNNIPFSYTSGNKLNKFILIYQKTKGKIKRNEYDLHLGYQVKNLENGEIFGSYTFKGITIKDYIKALPNIIISKYH